MRGVEEEFAIKCDGCADGDIEGEESAVGQNCGVMGLRAVFKGPLVADVNIVWLDGY